MKTAVGKAAVFCYAKDDIFRITWMDFKGKRSLPLNPAPQQARPAACWREDSKGERRFPWQEESNETGGFVAHDFRRKSSVLYLLRDAGYRNVIHIFDRRQSEGACAPDNTGSLRRER